MILVYYDAGSRQNNALQYDKDDLHMMWTSFCACSLCRSVALIQHSVKDHQQRCERFAAGRH